MISFTGKENPQLEDSELLRPHKSSRPRCCLWTSRLQGWRVTVISGACLSGVVLVLNISLLIWAHQTATDVSSEGILTLSRHNCPKVKNIMTWSHLGINILSTLLLGASTACMQCVSMPTRKEVDEAHERGIWLHLGVLGFRNFWHISNWRRAIWVLLALSSVPIHLLYNSTIFATDASNDFNAVIVTPGFLTGGKWNISDEHNFGDHWDAVKNLSQIQEIQDKANSLTRLETADCVREFSRFYISDWRDVVLVTNTSNEANTLLDSTMHDGDPSRGYGAFICQDSLLANGTMDTNHNMCMIVSNISTTAGATHWQIGLEEYVTKARSYKRLNVTVDFCLAQKVESGCSVNLSSPILAAVIFCNLVKLICLILSAAMRGFKPLVTTGDAIESFLTRPDAVTAGYGPASAVEIMRANPRKLKDGTHGPMSGPWKPVRHFWFAAASRWRWAVVLFCCFVAWTSVLLLLLHWGGRIVNYIALEDFKSWFSLGELLLTQKLVDASINQSISSNILLANSPQLLISLIYILYNGTFTSMLLTAESLGFATKRRPLRVTKPKPKSSQRSTYWLQLPYRYAIPLMATTGLLHWLISQTLFLIRIDSFDTMGQNDPTRGLYSCGWLPLAHFFATIVGWLLIVYLIANGFRRYTDKMPILSSCSLAISAACHRDPFEDEDMVGKPLQYGVLLSASDGSDAKVGFSGRAVAPCVEGMVYR